MSWMDEMSTTTLERIYTQTTDRQREAEILAELERRDS